MYLFVVAYKLLAIYDNTMKNSCFVVYALTIGYNIKYKMSALQFHFDTRVTISIGWNSDWRQWGEDVISNCKIYIFVVVTNIYCFNPVSKNKLWIFVLFAPYCSYQVPQSNYTIVTVSQKASPMMMVLTLSTQVHFLPPILFWIYCMYVCLYIYMNWVYISFYPM